VHNITKTFGSIYILDQYKIGTGNDRINEFLLQDTIDQINTIANLSL